MDDIPAFILRPADDALRRLEQALRDETSPLQIAQDFIDQLEAIARRADDRRWLLSRTVAHLYRLLEETKQASHWLEIPRIFAVIEAIARARQALPPIGSPRAHRRRAADRVSATGDTVE